MATKLTKMGSDGNLTDETAVATSAGAGDAGKIPELNGSGKLDDSIINASAASAANVTVKAQADGTIHLNFLPTGVGPVTKSLVASETLAAGDMINIWDDAGTIKMRKADADAVGTACDGFVIASVTSGASGTAYLSPGLITGYSGLTLGVIYFLSSTAGGMTTTPPSGTGKIVQRIGKAVSATELDWARGEVYVRG